MSISSSLPPIRRNTTKRQSQEKKKMYKSNPFKYLIIMGILLLIYLFFFIQGIELYHEVPDIDENRIIILSVILGSFAIIILSIIVAINGNYGKNIIITPDYIEYSKSGKNRFMTYWRELSFYISKFMGYRSVHFKGIVPGKNGNRKEITVYVDSMFFDKYDDIEKVILMAKKKSVNSAIHI